MVDQHDVAQAWPLHVPVVGVQVETLVSAHDDLRGVPAGSRAAPESVRVMEHDVVPVSPASAHGAPTEELEKHDMVPVAWSDAPSAQTPFPTLVDPDDSLDTFLQDTAAQRNRDVDASVKAIVSATTGPDAPQDLCTRIWHGFDEYVIDGGLIRSDVESSLTASFLPIADIYGSSCTPSQKSQSAKIEAKTSLHLLDPSFHERHRVAHFCLNHIPGASAWLFALPDSLESHIPAPLFRVSLPLTIQLTTTALLTLTRPIPPRPLAGRRLNAPWSQRRSRGLGFFRNECSASGSGHVRSSVLCERLSFG